MISRFPTAPASTSKSWSPVISHAALPATAILSNGRLVKGKRLLATYENFIKAGRVFGRRFRTRSAQFGMNGVSSNNGQARLVDRLVDGSPPFGTRVMKAERQPPIVLEHTTRLGKHRGHSGKLTGEHARVFVLYFPLVGRVLTNHPRIALTQDMR